MATTPKKDDFQDMETLSQNYFCIMELCPKYVGRILSLECGDKNPTETYKKYLERLRGQSFSQTEWKKKSGNKSMASLFETEATSDNMDMTTLFQLFQMIFEVKKNDTRDPTEVINKLKAVKDVRNDMTHNEKSMRDQKRIDEIEKKMKELIQKSGEFYKLPESETRLMEHDLQVEIRSGPTSAGKKLAYHIHRLLSEGKEYVRLRFQDLTKEDLPFDAGRVDRSGVFHAPEMTLQDEESKTFKYQCVFDASDKIVIVLGDAGAGKTTLLKNIILQFIKLQNLANTIAVGLAKPHPHFLYDFEILVHVECRDRTSKTLHEVFVGLFGPVCTDIRKEGTLQALSRLRVLFLVDAFDEHNEESIAVLRELLKETWHPKSRILITSRPPAVEKLRQLLAKNNCHYSLYVIAPLTQLDEQVEFIKKYEKTLIKNTAAAGAMSKRFSTLNPHIRALFVTPMALLQYCDIYLRSPQTIDNWKRASDVSGDTLNLYKTIFKEKLSDYDVHDIDVLINKLFVIIGKFALEFLINDKISFSEDEFLPVRDSCHSEIASYCGHNGLESDVLLSVMFSTKRSLSCSDKTTYSFRHKSIQERSAATYVKKRMMITDEPLLVILGIAPAESPWYTSVRQRLFSSIRGTQRPLDDSSRSHGTEPESVERCHPERLLEVMQYVLQDLSSSSPRQFQKRWPQLRDALTDAGVTRGADWQAVLLRSPEVTALARHAAEVTIKETDMWGVRSAGDVVAVALMLKERQPRVINIVMPAAVLRAAGTSWPDLARRYEGQLLLDIRPTGVAASPEPCDDLLKCLKGSRCQLTELWCGISSAAGVAGVASVATATTALYIALRAPLSLHALHGKYKHLEVHIWPLGAAWSVVHLPTLPPPCQEGDDAGVESPPSPRADVRLPALPAPELWVWGAEPGSCEAIAQAINKVAPHTKRLANLWVYRPELGEDEQWQLQEELQRQGVRSGAAGNRRYTRDHGGWVELPVTDVLRGPDGIVEAVGQVLMQLQSINAEDIEAQLPGVLRSMQEVGASAQDWWEALLCRPHEARLAITAAQATRAKDGKFMITCGRDLEAVAKMLPHDEDLMVEVQASPEVLRTPAWQQITQHHCGDMRLRLPVQGLKFLPCDDLLQTLVDSRCRVKRFHGGIRTAAGVAALAAIAASAVLRIRLEAPLDLSALRFKYISLGVYTLVTDIAMLAVPLPDTPPPRLLVMGWTAGSWEAVAQTVQAYAPISKRYGAIKLSRQLELSAEEVRRLLAHLHEAGIRTSDTGATRSDIDDHGWLRLRICGDL
ncbi:uncharacterized protein LOC125178854 [Hyalella azteca]|uniref:Uncharacterized protein LOC125178854 n=1 Tax=Hyalella azteca TaxID=294128 RepID=A0A979FU18_HYAAZ|nr:uncharacterized protein LOC125178854 [Hyalella azteca]